MPDPSPPDDGPLAFSFDAEHRGDPESLLELLGGKGCGLAVMTAMELPVPPGFTLTTVACRRFGEHGWTDDLDLAVRAGLAELEHATGRRLGDPEAPLLVSVRSGAEVSMPGMMDTVLDVGMTPAVADGLARATRDPAFAEDTRRRAALGYASLVRGAPAEVLRTAAALEADALDAHLAAHGVSAPSDPVEQVKASVRAVFRSWASPRAERFRGVEGIDHSLGTAVTVQAMVFGNLGEDSGTGVAFTRDPSTGRPGLMGDLLVRAQGDDVVAGARTTAPLAEMQERWPAAWGELVDVAARLEIEFADMVDIEFTVERGTLWLLQARRGKRSAAAAMRIAVDMAEDPHLPVDRAEAVRRCRRYLGVSPETGPGDDRADEDRAGEDGATVIASGLAGSPGRAAGVLCLDVDDAVRLHESGTEVVLVRRETSPADVHGMAAAVGLVTTLGGLVSHAAVVARSWGLPAVVGAGELAITADGIEGRGTRVAVGEVVTVDGDQGLLLLGDHGRPTAEVPEAEVLRAWAAELDAG